MDNTTFEFDVYISYSHQDRLFVQKLVNGLTENNIRVFVDYEQFLPGQPIVQEIERGLLNSAKMVVVLSPSYVQSQWTEFENIFIQSSDPTGSKGKAIPVLCSPTVLPKRLSFLTFVDFTSNKFEDAFAQLLNAVTTIPTESTKRSVDVEGNAEGQTIITGDHSVISIERDKILLEEVLTLNKQILNLITNPSTKNQSVRHLLFKNIEENIEDSNLCFVLIPFGTQWSRTLFDQHIKKACEKENLIAKRADDIYGVQGIMQDVWIYINKAGIIVGDLTTRNPNVFYEVGLAHALGKKVILITQNMEDVPFDLRAVRCIVYSLELDGPRKLETDLRKTLKSINESLESKTL